MFLNFRPAKNGSNGRANSVHMISSGQSPTGNGNATESGSGRIWRELQQIIRDRVEKFTAERESYSLWIFPQNDK